jgi:DNA ligase 1
MKAICQTTGRSIAQIKADVQNTGDLGIVVEKSCSSQRMMFTLAPHTLKGTFNKIKFIAKMSGHQFRRKFNMIKGISVACRHSEARFFIRLLAENLELDSQNSL